MSYNYLFIDSFSFPIYAENFLFKSSISYLNYFTSFSLSDNLSSVSNFCYNSALYLLLCSYTYYYSSYACFFFNSSCFPIAFSNYF